MEAEGGERGEARIAGAVLDLAVLPVATEGNLACHRAPQGPAQNARHDHASGTMGTGCAAT
jgi:hypothetical protein